MAKPIFHTVPDMLEKIANGEVVAEAIDLPDLLQKAATGLRALEAEVIAAKIALQQAEAWFQDYADGHTAKGDADKAQRNQSRADFCRRAALNKEGA